MFKKQFISILFAAVLLANLGHNFIPHHHHSDSIYSHQGCHEYDDTGIKLEDDPTGHCHAFNGIEYFPGSEKNKFDRTFLPYTGIFLPPPVRTTCTLSLLNPHDGSRGSAPMDGCIFGTSSGLRAPPHPA